MPGPFYFAWTGGAIEEQVTIVTNGTTHGAAFKTVTIVADTQTGILQLSNLASTSGLEVGSMYRLAGPGIHPGTLFVHDDATLLSGLPGSINIDNAPTTTEASAQFQATEAVPLGTVLATLTSGNPVIGLDAAGLPAGIYCISGAGIAETTEPTGTTDGTSATTGGGALHVAAAYVDYDGAGTGSMYVYGAYSHTSDSIGDYGEPETVTNYFIEQQPVWPTQSGQSPVLLTGFPSTDPASVTDIPSAAIARLTPGLRYNITGNGIPVGATFLAPSSGTAITLDLPATASDINAIFTITGPRVPNQATFNPAVHNRWDEEIISFDISQEEGGFATLTIDLKNPGIGLLAQGRFLWCWLSWDQAWPASSPDLVPLFNGRLIGAPRLQAGEIVQLQFLARPDDFNAQKENLADSLKVLPYYDPIWFTTSPTADTVLETYSALWHIDRVSLAVSVSDILEGEAGIVEVGEDIALYDRFSLSFQQPPLISTMIIGTVSWTQQATGSVNVTQILLNAFHQSSSAYRKWAFALSPWNIGGDGLIMTLAGNGLKSDWPAPGTSIGGGWSLSSGEDRRGQALCYCVDAIQDSRVVYNLPFDHSLPIADQTGKTEEQSNVSTFINPSATMFIAFPLNVYKIKMTLDYRANRKRTETITAVLTASVQPELSDSAENDRETISLTSQFVDQAVDLDGSVPIGNVAYRSYFQTGRGAASFEYLLWAARAKLRARARAVDITVAVPWRNALGITLRHSVRLTDYRLPGGVAVGKVKSAKLVFANGTMLGEFTIGCSIGTGDPSTPQDGIESYVEPAYVDRPYQVVTGAQIPLGVTGELAYQALDNFVIDDDGLDLTQLTTRHVDRAVNACTVKNGFNDQMTELAIFQSKVAPQPGNPGTILGTYTTQVTLDMKPVTGSEFSTAFFPGMTPLMLPKTIDLSAPAGG